jgi:hypothetical protein
VEDRIRSNKGSCPLYSKRIDWIGDYKNGSLTENYVLGVAKKVADFRKTPELIEETKSLMGLL